MGVRERGKGGGGQGRAYGIRKKKSCSQPRERIYLQRNGSGSSSVVERKLPKLDVASSILVSRSIIITKACDNIASLFFMCL